MPLDVRSAAASPFVTGGRPDAVGIGMGSVEYRRSKLEDSLKALDSYGVGLIEPAVRKNVWRQTAPETEAPPGRGASRRTRSPLHQVLRGRA
jgi:hypothetical protein